MIPAVQRAHFWRLASQRSGATNTVNFTMKQAAEKASADFRREDAKVVTTPLGMQWEPPKHKKETWSTVAPPALSREWLACKSLLDTMAYDELAEYLTNAIYDQKNGAIANARAILEKHVPSGAGLTRGTPEWSNPLPNRPWKKNVTGVVIVPGDDPVRLGKRPVHPEKFKLGKVRF